uniref:Noggin n=1 Tax=Lottia goshimai TaxID=1824450 RepID=A0A7D5A9A0_9GAST|nr:noggin [Lottia goshimai]
MRMKSQANNTLVSLLLGVQLLQNAFGKTHPAFQTLPREVHSTQSSLTERLFQLPSTPRHNRFYPKKRNLKTRKLLKRLGKAYDENWMSITQPVHIHEIVSNKIDHKLVAEARNVNFTTPGLPNSKQPNITSAMLSVFQDWLIQRGSCPVHFLWEDLGLNFWPRWVKRGFCVDEDSCSWPPGMHCVPAEGKRIRLLRWQCVPRFRRNGPFKPNRKTKDDQQNTTEPKVKKEKRKYGMKCKWMKIPYPVTDECFCSC